MALKFYDSPFHVNHDEETASKMVMKMDLSIMLSRLIESKQWTQAQAAEQLGVKQSRISDLVNAKMVKNSPLMHCSICVDKFGFQVRWTMRMVYEEPLMAVKPILHESVAITRAIRCSTLQV